MDSLLAQCGFCSHFNTSFATTCELCGDLLSPNLVLSVTGLLNPVHAPGYCITCARRLLLNNRSCTFCNALYNGSAVGSSLLFRRAQRRNSAFTAPLAPVMPHGTPTTPPRRVDALNRFADTLITVLINDNGAQDAQDPAHQALHPDARERLLQPVNPDPENFAAGNAEEPCVVCLEPLRTHSYTRLPCCANQFHLPCLQQWFNRRSTCPLCRQNLNNVQV